MTPPASDLDDGATLGGVQRYVAAMEAERGFTAATVPEQALLLGEEIGELFKAIRKSHNLATAHGSVIGTVEEELADVLIFVCSIANRLDVDLTTALRRKDAVNRTRTWSTPDTR